MVSHDHGIVTRVRHDAHNVLLMLPLKLLIFVCRMTKPLMMIAMVMKKKILTKTRILMAMVMVMMTMIIATRDNDDGAEKS